MAQLWDNGDPDLSGSKLLVVLCLADHSNDDGVCWPSINRLAERTRIDRRNIMRHLQSLEAMGYLEITRTPGRPNRYTVHATRGDITTRGKTITSGNSVTPTSGKIVTGTRGKIVTPPVVISPPEPSYNPNSEPSIQPPPRKADFVAAVAAWEAGGLMLSKTIADDIGEAVDHWAAKGYGHYVADAIEEATRQGKLTWAYVMGILRGCEREQRAPSNKPSRNGTDPANGKKSATITHIINPITGEKEAVA